MLRDVYARPVYWIPKTKPWARHGSTPYLWTEEAGERAIDYVINGQGDEPFEL